MPLTESQRQALMRLQLDLDDAKAIRLRPSEVRSAPIILRHDPSRFSQNRRPPPIETPTINRSFSNRILPLNVANKRSPSSAISKEEREKPLLEMMKYWQQKLHEGKAREERKSPVTSRDLISPVFSAINECKHWLTPDFIAPTQYIDALTPGQEGIRRGQFHTEESMEMSTMRRNAEYAMAIDEWLKSRWEQISGGPHAYLHLAPARDFTIYINGAITIFFAINKALLNVGPITSLGNNFQTLTVSLRNDFLETFDAAWVLLNERNVTNSTSFQPEFYKKQTTEFASKVAHKADAIAQAKVLASKIFKLLQDLSTNLNLNSIWQDLFGQLDNILVSFNECAIGLSYESRRLLKPSPNSTSSF